MRRWQGILAAAAAAMAAAARPAAAEAPPPDRLAADIIVSGRTSTAVKVDVVRTGSEIPATFAGDRVKNTPGFSWYVSRHWALKTDYPEEKARFYLTLLEQAYPHYVELFGREIAGIGRMRLAVCYASSTKRLKEALAGDGATWDFKGGGITLEQWKCAYQYPSGSLDYHQRYILLHECTHLYQLCLLGSSYTVPMWFTEGAADGLASHVYESAPRRLTLWVLDKATTRNHLDSGLAALRQSALTAEKIHDVGGADGSERGLPFLLVNFLATDPDRAQKFRLWRDEMFRRNLKDGCLAESSRLMTALFGPWRRIDEEFQAWAGALRSTFHYAEWGWEQDGDTLWSYGFAENGRLSETDVNLPPREPPQYHPLRMDWPRGQPPPLVGPVARGTAEPAVGCLLDFSRDPGRGRAGLGLGVIADDGAPPRGSKPPPDSPKTTSGVRVITIRPGKASGNGYLAVLVQEGRELLMEGQALGVDRRTVALPQTLRDAIVAGGHKAGLTVHIAAAGLEIVLRAKDPKAPAPAEFRTALALTAEQRERVLSRPMAVLSRDGRHGVTPAVDDARRPEPDSLLLAPAPPNRWRNPGDAQLSALYRAAWLLGEKAPPSLAALRERMLAAADKAPEEQKAAVAEFQERIAQVRQDIERSGAPAEAAAKALAALDQDAASK
ncbi:MAG: hypothetical protein FJ288_06400 [Planctomycetes bacterium]|nr:hypothetical protein [Planctomycetota bacterium]